MYNSGPGITAGCVVTASLYEKFISMTAQPEQAKPSSSALSGLSYCTETQRGCNMDRHLLLTLDTNRSIYDTLDQ